MTQAPAAIFKIPQHPHNRHRGRGASGQYPLAALITGIGL